MNYATIRRYDVANGPGVRTVLFVSGCTHNCEGCFNKEQQNFSFGNKWTKEVEDKFIEYCKDIYVDGVSILGGEPFQQNMDSDFINLLRRLKEEVGKPIWVWTGYTIWEVFSYPHKIDYLQYIDVLVDGKFDITKRDLNLMYRGSSNQNVIDVQKTLKENKLILLLT